MPKHVHEGHVGTGLQLDSSGIVSLTNQPSLHYAVTADGTISHSGATYLVDTLNSAITLTVDDSVVFFTIHDSGLNFALNNCTVDFGGGLTSVLDARGEMAVFFKDSAGTWHLRGFGAGVGTRVAGYPLPIVNGSAEQGLTGWTETLGAWEALDLDSRDGSNYFAARSSSQADLQQDVPVPAAAVPQLGRGSGSATLRLTWIQYALFGVDQANVVFEFFDANMVSLGTDPGPGLATVPAQTWTERMTDDIPLPINTHTIRITLQSRHAPGQGLSNYAIFDDVTGIVHV